ncbi:TPA: hypothetical protein U5D59_002879 [Yersinia enterocolitica]|nr:hypothetical protein [Yersinia enterocolitica]
MKTLKFKKKDPKCLSHRMVFVGKRDRSDNNFSRVSFWKVPKTGGYGGGCATGVSLASLYMQHLLEFGKSPCGTLQLIVLDMFNIENIDDSLKGQVVGFFTELEQYLSASAKSFSRHISRKTPAEFLKEANAGLRINKE